VIDKLKYELVLPPVMLMVAMAMEGEPRDTECKLHSINDAVTWNTCPRVHFHLRWLHERSVKNLSMQFQSFRSYGTSFAVEIQLDKTSEIDYALLAAPVFTSTYIETNHKVKT